MSALLRKGSQPRSKSKSSSRSRSQRRGGAKSSRSRSRSSSPSKSRTRSPSRSGSKSSSRSRSRSKPRSNSRSRSRSPRLNSRDATILKKGIKAFKKDLRVYKKNFKALGKAARLIYPHANLPDFGEDSPSPPPSPKRHRGGVRGSARGRGGRGTSVRGAELGDSSHKKAYDNWIKNARLHRGLILNIGKVEFNALKLEIINLFGDQIRQSWKTPETQALVKNYLCETGALTQLGRQTFKCDSSSESGTSSSESESGEGMQQDYGEVI